MIRACLCVLALLGLAGQVAASESVDLSVGGVTIRMPVATGYVAVSPLAPELRRVAEAALPPSNRLVDYFHTEENLAALLLGQNANGHFMMVQTARALEPATLSDEQWRAALPQIRSGMATWDPNSIKQDDKGRAERMSEAAGRDVAMRFGEMQQPTIYEEDADSMRFLMKLPVDVTVDGKSQLKIEAGAAGAIARVKGKLIFIYWYALPATPETIDAARRKLDATLDELMRLNAAGAD